MAEAEKNFEYWKAQYLGSVIGSREQLIAEEIMAKTAQTAEDFKFIKGTRAYALNIKIKPLVAERMKGLGL